MSSTNAIGLASPTMPISSEKPALRIFQKSSLSASTSRCAHAQHARPALKFSGQVGRLARPARPPSRRKTGRPERPRGALR